ncbi:putative disease resistance protein RGA1 [Silene latifolia]|uniref:putative disease resistance protein RGA1 n=1 Tax=Silene latifolia TaxID=37657 RepID=UPI003D76F54C
MAKLGRIAGKHSKYGLSLNQESISRRVETCSQPNTEIIGRDEDVENIVGILLDSNNVRGDVSFLTIVGMGGLGKTALAQLVYDHENITKEFPLRLWICVSDHDQSKLDVKTILTLLLESATKRKHDGFSMDVVVGQLQKELAGKRFLIVLDDLWSESCDELRQLVGYMVGGRGSQILVTSRSTETANILGTGLMYELKGLSDENSRRLFQLMAFGELLEQASPNRYNEFKDIGEAIVKTCTNVPLAIRVLGSLLYRQDISKWQSVQALGLANVREGRDGIKPILKLTYHNLQSSLKSCFSFCSLYPKDFEIRKDLLIGLWIAQGYIVPFEKGQSLEEAAEEYFLILLHRCFFHDIRKNQFDEILTFKLHDLMHDVATEVAEKEICVARSFNGDVNKEVRHVSIKREQYSNCSFAKAHIRTYLHVDPASYSDDCANVPVVTVLKRYKCLRVLDLSYLNFRILPDSIGKLIHLRYLDLSDNYDMEVLPKSITKLYNLQTLSLDSCFRLKELPKDLSKLVNLRVLGLSRCHALAFMPSGMGKLTDLYRLSKFVVGETNSRTKHVELEGLKALKKLRGSIEIDIHFPETGALVQDDSLIDGGYMRDKEHLDRIRFKCNHKSGCRVAAGDEENFLKALQPHANLKELQLVGYGGARMPRWENEDNLATLLPNLIRLVLDNCPEIQCLSSLGRLQHLKTLNIESLPKLEYVQSQPGSSRDVIGLFPRLENLCLRFLPKLKEWCQDCQQHQSALFFPQLKVLQIRDCSELTSLPHCPNVEELDLHRFNKDLQIATNATSSPKLMALSIDDMAWLQSWLPKESYQSLEYLKLIDNKEIENLTEFKYVLEACSSSLRTLEIYNCPKLTSLSDGLRSLVALVNLSLRSLPIDKLSDDGMPWESLCDSLHYLAISKCKELQSFPEWMPKLNSLRRLKVEGCSEGMYEKCQNPDGQDWPHIQHIPHKTITLGVQ